MMSLFDCLPFDLRKMLLHYFWFDDLETICKLSQFAVLDTDENFWKEVYSTHFTAYKSTKDICLRTWKHLHHRNVTDIMYRNYYNAIPYILSKDYRIDYNELSYCENINMLEFLLKNHTNVDNIISYFTYCVFNRGNTKLFKNFIPNKIIVNLNTLLDRIMWIMFGQLRENNGQLQYKEEKLEMIRYLLSLGADEKILSTEVRKLLSKN